MIPERTTGNSFKVVLVGCGIYGKQFFKNQSNESINYDYPNCANTFSTTIIVNAGDKMVTLNIWDVAGQVEYRNIAPMFLRGAQGVVIYDNSIDGSTITRLQNWLTFVIGALGAVPVIIAQNATEIGNELGPILDWAEKNGIQVVLLTQDNNSAQQVYHSIALLLLKENKAKTEVASAPQQKTPTPVLFQGIGIDEKDSKVSTHACGCC